MDCGGEDSAERMELEMTTREFTQGYQAGYAGDMSCPYAPATQQYKDWWLGYSEARVDIRYGR